MRRSVTVRVPGSTANLGPGFDCLGIALNLYNTITLRPAAVTEITVSGQGAGQLPETEGNLVLHAAAALAERAGITLPGWRCQAHNEIPLARGLGSSSAAIVGGLVACDQLLELHTPASDLLDLAAEIEGHPDNVAPALYGGLTVCAQEGGQTFCLSLPPPADLYLAVAIPNFEVSTNAAREVLPAAYSRADTVYNLAHASLTLAALIQGRYDLLGTAMQDKVHQPYRRSLVPGMAEVIAAAAEAGAYTATLSGSGPSIVAFCKAEDPAIGEGMVQAFARQGIRAEVRWLKPAIGALDQVQVG